MLGLLPHLLWAADDFDLSRFETETLNNAVRVKASGDLPDQAWQKACRAYLSQPARVEVKKRLEQKMAVSVPEPVSFVSAELNNYRSWKESGWLYCQGSTKVTDWPKNLSALAVRAAWHFSDQNEHERIKPFLREALQHPYAAADAVALIAKLAPGPQRLSYLDDNLNEAALTLSRSFQAVASIWLDAGRWQSVINLTSRCNSVGCRKLKFEAEKEKEREDAEKADDLSSYF